jgi:hypothetical protein
MPDEKGDGAVGFCEADSALDAGQAGEGCDE